MKKVIIAAAIAMACIGCSVSKRPKSEPRGGIYDSEPPCLEYYRYNDNFIGGTGYACIGAPMIQDSLYDNQDRIIKMTRKAAIYNAKSIIVRKVRIAVDSISVDYCRNITDSAQAAKVHQIMENCLMVAADSALTYAELTCDKAYLSYDNSIECWVGLIILKKDLIEKMVGQLERNDEYKFDTELFHAYAKKRMNDRFLPFE